MRTVTAVTELCAAASATSITKLLTQVASQDMGEKWLTFVLCVECMFASCAGTHFTVMKFQTCLRALRRRWGSPIAEHCALTLHCHLLGAQLEWWLRHEATLSIRQQRGGATGRKRKAEARAKATMAMAAVSRVRRGRMRKDLARGWLRNATKRQDQNQPAQWRLCPLKGGGRAQKELARWRLRNIKSWGDLQSRPAAESGNG